MSELFEESVQLERHDGVELPAIRITPEFEAAESCNGAGVLVVAGEWGLSPADHARFVTPLAEFGYFVVAMDLVRGGRIESAEAARERAAGLDHAIAIDDIAAGILNLKELASGKLGVIALDVAATIALEAAAVLPQLDAVVHIAGRLPSLDTQLTRLRATILVHRAERGTAMTDDDYRTLAARMKRSRAQLLGHTYPTDHDRFFVDPRATTPELDEAFHARVAWDRTRDFLATALT